MGVDFEPQMADEKWETADVGHFSPVVIINCTDMSEDSVPFDCGPIDAGRCV